MRLAQAHSEWALGFEDEVWWSRLAQPRLHSWAEADAPLRLLELTRPTDDHEPKALACYGVLVRRPGCPATPERMLLRFVDGRPVSAVTSDFLQWACQRLARQKVKVWVLIWDNASWHVSQAVRTWLREHNRQVKRTGQGVRILACYLPSKSPWLNPIEPKWLHGKRAIVEPDRLLSPDELAGRVCARFGCVHEPHLKAPEKVL
ncbi:MAG: transposase [Anaerolineales bacterium]|nr:transposase [Anaerolineales bacterium]